ncbi:hypothetical protein HJ588_14755 [Flexivirga sp. ID2601S]|uniref:Uncharacterized protein n=1 Tax=Flexivirga aerilata TaxID=1656889 RepID=A0A849AL49_9MICO|nr:hypothetical protein [Flexivirga aerilata]NNG40527.1 hypothetical protein [Flexivirga aerilata]
MPLFRSRPQVPDDVLARLELPRGEKVLAAAVDANTGAHVVATTLHLAVVTDRSVALRKPWHLVDAGQWEPQTWTLTVTWVDGSRPGQWTFAPQDTRLPETVHERVQSTVVLSEPLPLTGRRRGRVVIRRDLQTGGLLTQTVLGRGVRGDDPEVAAAVSRVSAYLQEQVGL